jgi:hypothetical protein
MQHKHEFADRGAGVEANGSLTAYAAVILLGS